MTVESRGTSNANDRGSAEARRQRKTWLFEVWAADRVMVEFDYVPGIGRDGDTFWGDLPVGRDGDTFWDDLPVGSDWSGQGGYVRERPLVRCFRCGKLCDWDSVEIDRIKPGAEGGRYTKSNIRPCCSACNKVLSGEWTKKRNAKQKLRNQQARIRRAERREAAALTDATDNPTVGMASPVRPTTFASAEPATTGLPRLSPGSR